MNEGKPNIRRLQGLQKDKPKVSSSQVAQLDHLEQLAARLSSKS